MDKATAIRRAKQHLAGFFLKYLYTNDIKGEWVLDILLALRDKIDFEIQQWEEA